MVTIISSSSHPPSRDNHRCYTTMPSPPLPQQPHYKGVWIFPTCIVKKKGGTETQKETFTYGQTLQNMYDSGRFPILAIKSARVGEYNGKNAGPISTSKLFIDPDFPEAHRIKVWFDKQRECGIQDHTGITWVTAFEKGGEAIMGVTTKEETFDDDSRVKITVTKAEKINFSSETSFLLDMLKKDHPSSLVPMIEMPPAGSGRQRVNSMNPRVGRNSGHRANDYTGVSNAVSAYGRGNAAQGRYGSASGQYVGMEDDESWKGMDQFLVEQSTSDITDHSSEKLRIKMCPTRLRADVVTVLTEKAALLLPQYRTDQFRIRQIKSTYKVSHVLSEIEALVYMNWQMRWPVGHLYGRKWSHFSDKPSVIKQHNQFSIC
ncbi:nucleic acid-binding, OB-fold protein [Tanacetum coccineum]